MGFGICKLAYSARNSLRTSWRRDTPKIRHCQQDPWVRWLRSRGDNFSPTGDWSQTTRSQQGRCDEGTPQNLQPSLPSSPQHDRAVLCLATPVRARERGGAARMRLRWKSKRGMGLAGLFPNGKGNSRGLPACTAGARKTATSAPLQLPREPQHQLNVRIRRRLKPLRSLLETPMRMAVMTSPHQRLGLLDRYVAESQ